MKEERHAFLTKYDVDPAIIAATVARRVSQRIWRSSAAPSRSRAAGDN